jgi:adenosylcobinamide amidohydrolase
MILLPDNSRLDHTPDHVHIGFPAPRPVVSSAVLNGGAVSANHILNLRVAKHLPSESGRSLPSPSVTLQQYCDERNWKGTTVGMMTAASMNSFRIARGHVKHIEVIAMATSGLSNPLRAGDPAECRHLIDHGVSFGTINIIILTTAFLAPAAMVESLMIATEAKTCVFQSFGIKSRVSNDLATGTGTDAIVCACSNSSDSIQYCGKHLIFGEVLARLVIEALTPAIKWELDQKRNGNL